MLGVAAVALEGAPPALDAGSAAGFAFTSLVATALAYLCWFGGLARLRAATVGAVGLLNPATGVLLGARCRRRDAHPGPAGRHPLGVRGILATTRSGTARRAPGPVLLPSPGQDLPVLAGARF